MKTAIDVNIVTPTLYVVIFSEMTECFRNLQFFNSLLSFLSNMYTRKSKGPWPGCSKANNYYEC